MVSGNESDGLKRGLKNRHIQLIALGGALGTGCSSASRRRSRWPARRCCSATRWPASSRSSSCASSARWSSTVVAGSFSYFANKYVGHFTGFLSGWNYWVLYILVSMAELSAVGIYVQYWWPGVPTWVSALVFFVAINLLNLPA